MVCFDWITYNWRTQMAIATHTNTFIDESTFNGSSSTSSSSINLTL